MANNRGFSSAVAATARQAVPVAGLAAHLGRGLQRVTTDAVSTAVDRSRGGLPISTRPPCPGSSDER